MNLRQLEVFVAVVETGSFSRGAQATCLTQSTVSQHIASLEVCLTAMAAGFCRPRRAKFIYAMPGACWLNAELCKRRWRNLTGYNMSI